MSLVSQKLMCFAQEPRPSAFHHHSIR